MKSARHVAWVFFWHAPWIWCRRIARNIRHLSDSWSMLEPHFIRSPPIYHWIGLREILQESPEIFSWVKTVKTMVFGEDFPTNPWNCGWWTPYLLNCSGWAQYVRLQRQRASSDWRTAGEKVRSGGARPSDGPIEKWWKAEEFSSFFQWLIQGPLKNDGNNDWINDATGNIWLYLVIDPVWPMAGVDSSARLVQGNCLRDLPREALEASHFLLTMRRAP